MRRDERTRRDAEGERSGARNQSTRRRWLEGMGLATAGLFAGCSDGGDEEASTTAPGGSPTERQSEAPEETTDQSTSDADGVSEPLVGSHYVTWLYPGKAYPENDWTDDSPYTPTLGNYDVRDSAVNRQHIEWATEYGVNWFWASWWRPDGPSDQAIRSLMDANRSSGPSINWSLLYESTGRLSEPRNLSLESKRDRIAEDFGYFAEEFFDAPNYLHVDGRPVVFVYVSHTYLTDHDETLAEAYDAAFSDLDARPYLVGHYSYPLEGPRPAGHEQNVAAHDAITTYNSYTPRDDIAEIDFVEAAVSSQQEWAAVADEHDTAFIPEVVPGFDDTEIDHVEGRPEHPVLPRSVDRFREMAERARPLRDEGLQATFVTSWNEWFESTQIEPSEEEGFEYLSVVKETLAAR